VAVPVATAVAAIPVGLPVERRRSRVGRDDDDEDDRPRARRARAVPVQGGGLPVWAHLAPVGALLLMLLAVLLVDVFRRHEEQPPEPAVNVAEDKIDPDPLIEVGFHDAEKDVSLAVNASFKSGRPQPGTEVTAAVWEPSMRFGVEMVRGVDGGTRKKLTRELQGETNNTVVRLDDVAPTVDGRPAGFQPTDGLIFGDVPWRRKDGMGLIGLDFAGRWKDGERDVAKGKGGGRKSTWVYPDQNVEVTQIVEVVAGEQSRKLDTCLVRYVIKNNDTKTHRVGLRFMLDTFIGQNDGVPFTIPGEKELCADKKEFDRPQDVPDFVEALEKADLKNPGTVARVQFRLGERIEPPGRVTIGGWPDPVLATSGMDARCRQEKTFWAVPVLPINAIKSVKPDEKQGDSCVVMYWDMKMIAKGGSREVGFAYGLGDVAASDKDSAGRLGLSLSKNSIKPGDEFELVAYVGNPQRGEELTLELPPGFKLVGSEAAQPVPPVKHGAERNISPVTWKIKAGRDDGIHKLKVKSSAGPTQSKEVRIRSTSIFD